MEEKSYLKDHVVKAEKLVFDLHAQLESLRSEVPEDRDRRGITLVKEHGATVVLTVMRSGAVLREHGTAGPATVQVLEGQVEMRVGGETSTMTAGGLVAFDAGVTHEVVATSDAAILITVFSGEAGG